MFLYFTGISINNALIAFLVKSHVKIKKSICKFAVFAQTHGFQSISICRPYCV